MRRGLGLIVVSLALAGCAATPTPTPLPSATATALKIRTEADAFCPLAKIRVPRLTMRLDPKFSDQVWATSDDGTKFGVWWPEGFQIGEDGGPVVLDTNSQVAAADGDVILVPDRGFPLLRGRTVCAGSGNIYLMPSNPS